MALLTDIIDEKDLSFHIEEGHVRASKHPELPLVILNYTAACQYEQAWTTVTRKCRGLIYEEETMKLVARSFPKFHNLGEHTREDDPIADIKAVVAAQIPGNAEWQPVPPRPKLAELRFDAPVEVTDKMDGSLGVIFFYAGEWAIATRGSFTSDQARWATKKLYEQPYFNNLAVMEKRLTYLVEIVYPENRIVVDYKGLEALVLLGAVEIETGKVESAHDLAWIGPRADQFEAATLAEALLLEPRDNVEGVVVRYLDDDAMVKIKQEDYVVLHRIMTGLNARNVWELVAAQQCQHLIKERNHWGSYVGFGWERAEECLAIADDWLEGVPDEFHAWVRNLTDDLIRSHEIRFAGAVAESVGVRQRYPDDRKAQYEAVAHNPYVKEMVAVIREHNIDPLFLKIWKNLEPEPVAPFDRSEDVA